MELKAIKIWVKNRGGLSAFEKGYLKGKMTLGFSLLEAIQLMINRKKI